MLNKESVMMAAIILSAFLSSLLIQNKIPMNEVPSAPRGMVWIPGGSFSMGGVGNESRRDELPTHPVKVSGFFIGKTEVTNREYSEFIEATGYTTIAERSVDWEQLKKQVPEGTPKPSAEMLVPGSMVFQMPTRIEGTDDYSQWWTWVPGACWKNPEGPDSTITDRMDHPVVHVSWPDAVEYAKWIGGSLPTEAQWEFAARGGLASKPFIWGTQPIDATHANTWQGTFPIENTGGDGFPGTAPVGTFPANGYGLLDMGGNVWEWCLDHYQADVYAERIRKNLTGDEIVDPVQKKPASDPRHPHAPETMVQRGGSFLCNPSYCSSYRPSARMSTTPDSASSHAGFRVVMSSTQAKVKEALVPKQK